MEKTDKKTLVKVYTGPTTYLLNSILGQNSNFNLSRAVIDLSLSEKVARVCKREKLDYIACGEDEEKTAKLKKILGFKDRYSTGM